MTILLAMGVVLVVFGGLVLLLFPDRPGGKVGWQGLEVSSVGAGLPVIVVGIVAVGFAALHGNGFALGSSRGQTVSSHSKPTAAAGCLGRVLQGIPSRREKTLELGARASPVTQLGQPTRGPFGLRLDDAGKTVGGVVFSYFDNARVFRVSKVVDKNCKPVEGLRDYTQPSGNPHQLQNWDDLQIRLGKRMYYLRLGSEPPLEADFTDTPT